MYLRKGYYLIPMHPADIKKTATITLFGPFKILLFTFSLMNAGSTFQRLMDQVLAGLINDEDRRAANKLPGLGDLPLIGRLFGSNLTFWTCFKIGK
jgi:hypothetical protein